MSDDLSKTESENLSASQESDSLHCIDSIFDDDDSDTCEKTTEKQVEQNVEINRRTKKAACKSDESDKEKDKDSNSEQKLKKKKKRNLWWLKISIISFILAAFFSFLSDLTSSFGNLIVILLLLIFLVLGSIIFDGIGVAVTSCDLAPLLSMSSRKVYGAKTAVKLVKNAEKVSNICNDVIGDIFGIISGGCSIVIVLEILKILPSVSQQLITILISSLVAAVTIGGKAILKEVAIKNSKELVMFVSKFLALFSKEERKIRKKK